MLRSYVYGKHDFPDAGIIVLPGFSQGKVDFTLSRNFFVGKHVNFTRVNKIEVTNEASPVNVKVEPCFRLRVTYLYRKKRCILRSLITNTWIQCTSSNYARPLSCKRGKLNLP